MGGQEKAGLSGLCKKFFGAGAGETGFSCLAFPDIVLCVLEHFLKNTEKTIELKRKTWYSNSKE